MDAQLLKEIVRRVLAAAKPDKIILFGSAASGSMTRDSDIDLLIIEGNPGDLRKQSLRIRENLIGRLHKKSPKPSPRRMPGSRTH